MVEPSWQEVVRQRLVERNNRSAVFEPFVEQYRRLASQTRLLKERNASLLRAVGAVGSLRPNPNSSTVFVPGADDNPVRVAYVTSLEQQISALREELATVYKAQGQNTQRLLAMTETLREREELARGESENLRKAMDEIASLRRKVDQHNEIMVEKDRTAQILTDEINTLQLELGQIEERNTILTRDNAKLLQRWLDAKQADANKMNEANDFYEDMRSRHQAVLNWRERSTASASEAGGDEEAAADQPPTSESGNGKANGDRKAARKDGTKFPPDSSTSMNPNG